MRPPRHRPLESQRYKHAAAEAQLAANGSIADLVDCDTRLSSFSVCFLYGNGLPFFY